jgi:predicted ATP-grasp superfamily ATP-dependent carboligase
MTDIIVLGASARPAAFSALRAGLSPYAIDLFADRDLTAVCPAIRLEEYPRGLVAALKTAPKAPWIYTGGLENHPRLVDQMAAVRPLLGNDGRVLRDVRNPFVLGNVVREAGLAFPETVRGPAEAPGRSGASAHSWLLKPRGTSGGRAVRFAQPSDLARPPPGTYLQRYIEGQSASAVYVAAGGAAMLLGTSRQLIGRDFGLDRQFTYVGSIAPLPLRADEEAKLRRLGDALAARFNLVGLFNVDFIRTESQLWPVEVNPRYSASVEVLEHIAHKPFFELHVAACKEQSIPGSSPPVDGRFAGKAVVYARRDVCVAPDFERLVEEWNEAAPAPAVADLPRIGDCFATGQPTATVLAYGDSHQAVESQLQRRVEALHSVLSTEY